MKLQIPILSKLVFAIFTIALLIYATRKDFSKQFIFTSLFLVIIGLSTHIYLIVRTQYQPFLNHGHPHNLKMFLDYILRRQYGNTTFLHRRASFVLSNNPTIYSIFYSSIFQCRFPEKCDRIIIKINFFIHKYICFRIWIFRNFDKLQEK